MEDKLLIKEIQKGKKEYLNDIAEKYYDDIYRFCCFQTGNSQDAYDLVQETFLKFIRYVDSYTYKNLKGYLLTIAMNLCRDYFSRPERRHTINIDMEEMERLKNTQSLEGENMDGKLVLIQALGSIKPQQREAIVMVYAYGYKYGEIAKMTGTNLSTVKSRVYQGTEKLRQILKKEDFYG